MKAWKINCLLVLVGLLFGLAVPDAVLLAFFIGNDVADNSRVLKKKDYHPYYVFEGDKLVRA